MHKCTHTASATCPPLPDVDSAEIFYTEVQDTISSNFPVNTRGVYECTPEEELFDGDALRICLASGSWSGQAPICSSEFL